MWPRFASAIARGSFRPDSPAVNVDHPLLEDDVRLATLVYSLFGASAFTSSHDCAPNSALTHSSVKVAELETF